MLRSLFPCVLVLVLLSSVLIVPARAELIDYNDYVYKVEVVGDQNLVYVKIPADMALVRVYDRDNNYTSVYYQYGQTHDIPFEPGRDYRIEVNVFGSRYSDDNGLDLSLIPPGTKIVSGLGFTFDGNVPAEDWGGMTVAQPRVFYHYYEKGNSNYIDGSSVLLDSSNTSWVENIAYCSDTHIVKNLDNMYRLCIAYFWQPVEWIAEPLPTGITITDTTLVFTISSLLRQQQLSGKTNALLKEVEAQLAEQGKTLDDIRDQMEDVNDKLDELPGEIGDEIQGVIDNEKQEAQSSGNQFVDQILGALPDPSTKVLGALKGLTDATSYTGTKAALTIPPIVLPGIGDLFPTTEIWCGAEFDFGEYIEYLPSTLLTLVRSLFTIAIVLYCVYELKGIISYCLTLRSNKGG